MLKNQLDTLGRNAPAELTLELPGQGQVLTLYRWEPWSDTIPFKYCVGTGPLKADDFKRWIDALALTVWFPLTIINTGRTAATDVLVDLSIRGCKRVLFQRPEASIITDSPSPNVLEMVYDTRRDAHVQRIELLADVLTIRQRIKRVLGKSHERLVFFGVVLDDGLEWPEDNIFAVTFSIRDATGAVQDGALQLPVTIRPGEPLNAGTAQNFYTRQSG